VTSLQPARSDDDIAERNIFNVRSMEIATGRDSLGRISPRSRPDVPVRRERDLSIMSMTQLSKNEEC
jgi:hypothetical protein